MLVGTHRGGSWLDSYVYGSISARDARSMVLGALDDIRGASLASASALSSVAADTAKMEAQLAVLPFMSDVLGSELPAIRYELQTSNALLVRLVDIAAHPEATAAAEHFQRAVQLYNRYLWPEARTELTNAARHDPYDPSIHFLLGQVHIQEGDEAAAASSFALAQRYGTDRRLSAGASLLAASCYGRIGRSQRQNEILEYGCKLVDDCPELLVAAARQLGDSRLWANALTLAPELAPEAELYGGESARGAAEEALATHTAEAREGYECIRKIIELLPSDAELAIAEEPADNPFRALAWTTYIRRELAHGLAKLESQLRAMPVAPAPVRPVEPTKPRRTGPTIYQQTVLFVSAVPSFGITLLLWFLWTRDDRRKKVAYKRDLERYRAEKADYDKALETHERERKPELALRESIRSLISTAENIFKTPPPKTTQPLLA